MGVADRRKKGWGRERRKDRRRGVREREGVGYGREGRI